MSEIYKLIQQCCPHGVPLAKVGDIIEYHQGGALTRHQVLKEGKYPVMNGGTTYSGYYSESNCDDSCLSISHWGSYAGHVHRHRGKFWANNACWVFAPKSTDECLLLYLYYILKQREGFIMEKYAFGGATPNLNRKMFESMEIPLPPIPVQQEIVRILDSFSDLQDNLQQELEVRKKQGVFLKKRMLSESLPSSIDYFSLSECCTKTSNIKWKTQEDNEYNYIDLSSVDITHMEIGETSLINKTNAPSRAQQIVREGDILIGTTRPTQKRICLVPPKYDEQICSTGFCVVRANRDVVLPKWILHIITEGSFWEYAEKVQKGASYPSMSNAEVLAFKIPLPTLSVQNEIIEQLDVIDSLIRNISLEIDARQKQYEYYREQLLTF